MGGDVTPAGTGQLVGRYLQRGDDEAFDQLYLHHAPRIRRRLNVRWGLSHEIAQDVLQETFLRGARDLHKIADPNKFGSWLTTIADRQAMATWGSAEVPTGGPDELESQARPTPSADHSSEVVDTLVLRKAIEALPSHLRAVVDLHYTRNLTITEVSDVLDCTPTAVRALLSAARKRLAVELAIFRDEPQPERPAAPLMPEQYERAMRRLTPRRREVLERYVYRRMTPAQIAEDLSLTQGCVRVHLHLAHKELASLLEIDDHRIVVDQLNAVRARM